MSTGLWVVDTNVVVSGIITRDADSPVAIVLDRMLGAAMRFALCEELVAEYRNVLLRAPIRRLHGLNEEALDRLLETLIANATIADISERAEAAPEPGDHHLWRLMAACSGAGLITGDALLIANPRPGGLVLAARGYLNAP